LFHGSGFLCGAREDRDAVQAPDIPLQSLPDKFLQPSLDGNATLAEDIHNLHKGFKPTASYASPIRLKQTRDKRVIQPAEDSQVEKGGVPDEGFEWSALEASARLAGQVAAKNRGLRV